MDGFQPARRILDVLADIDHQQLLLPAIQREFVWSEAKICALFDSLMRGYPIGGFLFWKVSNETVGSNAFYGFIRDFDVRPPEQPLSQDRGHRALRQSLRHPRRAATAHQPQHRAAWFAYGEASEQAVGQPGRLPEPAFVM
jgi:hypothetical protein